MFKTDKTQSDLQKIYKLNLIIASLIAVIATIGLTITHAKNTFAQIEKRQNDINISANVIAMHVYGYDFSAATSVAQTLLTYGYADKIKLFGRNNTLIYQTKIYPNTSQYAPEDSNVSEIKLYNPNTSQKSDENVIGRLQIWHTPPNLLSIVFSSVLMGMMAFILIYIPCYFLIRHYIRNYVVQPIDNLSKAIDSTLVTGAPVKSIWDDNSYIGRFAKQFNSMQDRLIHVQKNLRRQSQISREQTTALTQILIAGKQSVRHFGYENEVKYYNLNVTGWGLFTDIPEIQTLCPETLKKAILARNPTLKVRITYSQIANISEPEKAFELEITDRNLQVRSVIGFSILNGHIAHLVTDVTHVRSLENMARQNEKMEALGTMASGVAHDVNNVLAIIYGNLQIIEAMSERNSNISMHTKAAIQASERGSKVVGGLISYTRKREENAEIIDISACLIDLETMLNSTLPKGIKLKFDIVPKLYSRLDRSSLDSAILNLITNAVHEMPNGGTITVGTRKNRSKDSQSTASKDYVEVFVKDEGNGIPDDVFDKLITPFFTLKNEGKGTGMGLAIVDSFSKRYNGNLTYHNNVDKGATFILQFQLEKEPKLKIIARDQEPYTEKQLSDKKVLYVDDEVAICKVMELALGQKCKKVKTALGVTKVEAILKKNTDFDIVLTDMVLEDGNGADVYDIVKKYIPDCPVVLISGNLDYTDQNDNMRQYYGQYTKPQSIKTISNIIATCPKRESDPSTLSPKISASAG